MRQLTTGAICLALLASYATTPVLAAGNSGRAQANASVLVNATPKVVWRAVHEERNVDPDVQYSKVLKQTPQGETIEQKFLALPMLGDVTAVTQTSEQPYRRIDYSLVRSDKFKDLSGTWTLTPANGGKATLLNLSSTVDVGVPFSGMFIRNTTRKRLNRRIGNVKQLAEHTQAELAAKGQQDL